MVQGVDRDVVFEDIAHASQRVPDLTAESRENILERRRDRAVIAHLLRGYQHNRRTRIAPFGRKTNDRPPISRTYAKISAQVRET